MDNVKVFLFGLGYALVVVGIAVTWAYLAFGKWILYVIGG